MFFANKKNVYYVRILYYYNNFFEVPFWRAIISRQEIQFDAFTSIKFC
jgi:hypothetical protein